jgi:hypothetical protein
MRESSLENIDFPRIFAEQNLDFANKYWAENGFHHLGAHSSTTDDAFSN